MESAGGVEGPAIAGAASSLGLELGPPSSGGLEGAIRIANPSKRGLRMIR
jgi:hypothetical protein